jgi:hypothetical protein
MFALGIRFRWCLGHPRGRWLQLQRAMFAAQTLHVRIVKRVRWIKSELRVAWSPSASTLLLTPGPLPLLILLITLILLLRLIKRFDGDEPAIVVEREHIKLVAAHGVMNMLRHALGLVSPVNVEVSAPPHIKCSYFRCVKFHGLNKFAKSSCYTVAVHNLIVNSWLLHLWVFFARACTRSVLDGCTNQARPERSAGEVGRMAKCSQCSLHARKVIKTVITQ